ncbi:MAG: sulfatase-like hydrolase/transferase [Paludibacter sp.]|nr:sulfatase-like hydrolase/transferase [Paludibacter sp.]
MKRVFILLATIIFSVGTISLSAKKPLNVVLFMIDGMHWEAPQKLNMPVLNSLIQEGTYIQKSYMIIPHHPTVGDYSKFNSCSFPNPMLHEGTIFIRPQNKMIQEMISPKFQTAFVVNTTAYRSVGKGFSTCIMDNSLSDNQVVEQAVKLLENQDIRFMRVHLQSPGVKGVTIAMNSDDKPYARNIWGKGSPYVSAIENGDKLLGEFVTFLKKSGKWESTVLIVTSDHGQSNVGWHPMLDEDSWSTPMVFAGNSIAKGRKLPYFEHTDLAPTIAWLLGVKTPNNDGGAGKPVKEIMGDCDIAGYHPPEYIKTINEQIRSYCILNAQMVLASEKDNYLANILSSLENENLTPEPFYHHDRITDWNKAGSTQHLIEANQRILDKMQTLLSTK